MEAWIRRLSNAEPLDLTAPGLTADFPLTDLFADFTHGEHSLLEHTQGVMNALLADPPPQVGAPDEPASTPWWQAMPDAYIAAFFEHVGLPDACSPAAWPRSSRGRRGSTAMPHARESARFARELLREQGLPFALREHVAALVLHWRRPASLVRSGAPARTYRKLSCELDLRSLLFLARADLQATAEGTEDVGRTLDVFERKLTDLGLLGRPVRPPMRAEVLEGLGVERPDEVHRMLNAARYFELAAGMTEPAWFSERFRQERDRARGRLNILIGVAGCGKSTWAEENLADTAIVSSDRMREELTGDPGDQSQNYLVFQRCMDRVRTLLNEGREVTFDATNYSEDLRSMPVQAGRWCAAEIIGYYFDVGLNEALARNNRRPRTVPETVIRRQYRLLEPPALYEADRHFAVDAEGRAARYWPPPEAAPSA
jgi:predicted kinase